SGCAYPRPRAETARHRQSSQQIFAVWRDCIGGGNFAGSCDRQTVVASIEDLLTTPHCRSAHSRWTIVFEEFHGAVARHSTDLEVNMKSFVPLTAGFLGLALVTFAQT